MTCHGYLYIKEMRGRLLIEHQMKWSLSQTICFFEFMNIRFCIKQ